MLSGLPHSECNLHVIVLSQGDPGAEGLPGIPGPPGEDGAAGLKVSSLSKPVYIFIMYLIIPTSLLLH